MNTRASLLAMLLIGIASHIGGNNRFMNMAFNLNPTLAKTSPYAPLGASLMLLPVNNLNLKFFAFDTEGEIDRSGFDTLFNGATTFLGNATVTTNFSITSPRRPGSNSHPMSSLSTGRSGMSIHPPSLVCGAA